MENLKSILKFDICVKLINILLLVIIGLFFAFPAHAKCIANDKWHGPDKQHHPLLGGLSGAVGAMYFNDPWRGALTGTAIGATKELVDLSGAGTCSFQDFAVTSAGSFLGAYTLGRWAVKIRANEARITYRLNMNLDRLGE